MVRHLFRCGRQTELLEYVRTCAPWRDHGVALRPFSCDREHLEGPNALNRLQQLMKWLLGVFFVGKWQGRVFFGTLWSGMNHWHVRLQGRFGDEYRVISHHKSSWETDLKQKACGAYQWKQNGGLCCRKRPICDFFTLASYGAMCWFRHEILCFNG